MDSFPIFKLFFLLCHKPRTGHKQFSVYFKDYLVKQGVKQANAEALVSNVSASVNTIGFQVLMLMSVKKKCL